MTQITSDGAVTAVTNCSANGVETSRKGGPIYHFGQDGYMDPLDGRHCPL